MDRNENCVCGCKESLKVDNKESFVERMQKEHDELDIKRQKLDKFIKSAEFKNLDMENKFLLCAQLNSMANYQMILYRRIVLNESKKDVKVNMEKNNG